MDGLLLRTRLRGFIGVGMGVESMWQPSVEVCVGVS
jgi:hypothetical protein